MARPRPKLGTVNPLSHDYEKLDSVCTSYSIYHKRNMMMREWTRVINVLGEFQENEDIFRAVL